MDINLSLFGQMITFAILVIFTMKFVWPPLTHMMDERVKRIADGLASADRAKQDLALAEKAAADKLREAKQHATEIIAQAEKRGAQLVEEAKGHAKAEGERLVAGAQAEIDQQIQQTKEALRQQVAGLVLQGAEQILRREVDASAHAELLASIKAEL
ncbi:MULTISPECIES: F0F1 ATP synthase subunit B [unclassified Iodobacter]|uniref:F0F1 ATP synthase subunit B n=1 Tax=unclassified Iodobacter TaxID=235634 RepID=UPI0025E4DF12|nr:MULTISPECIES: F0F1 ATP synthase subunit B [unclassified Iodobacter]MDW5415353.1 F0F1 ATP synthase subunit B [Iodobacter sp. CM08]